jgi:hypothetical protein
LEPLLFDKLNHRFVVSQKFRFVPQAVHMSWRIVPKGLVRPDLVVKANIPAQGRTGNLHCRIRGITVNLFLVDRTIPALLAAIVGRPSWAARGKNHLQIPNEPPGAMGHVRKS